MDKKIVIFDKMFGAGVLLGLLYFCCSVLTGCSSGTGWQFQIGITPITGVENHQALKPENTEARAWTKNK